MSALDDLVAVMARLRGPGGCPWDAEQTHASLVPYAIEEAHELAEAVEAREAGLGDDAHLREELGDVLLQVVFHADIARAEGRFDVDDVARTLIEKLRRRHPHVFDDLAVDGVADVVANWDAIKRAEKPERSSALDGIPVTLPALARAEKTMSRARRAGLALPQALADAGPADGGPADGGPADEQALGAALLALVQSASEQGLDAERALRTATRALEHELRAQESAQRESTQP
ncbi:MazG family protein [Agrococcus citreus]|uniref:NTP pyrophosphohydrolase MazG-like domain-containing protein n=1 Tax=Agrococcus citreus TaxID=84643 RepID=A0ABN1YZ17_9MICO